MLVGKTLTITVRMGLALMAVAPLSAGTLYSQPFDATGSAYASQNDTGGGNGSFATVYDNFTLSGGGSITGVSWTGEYFNPASRGTITQWTVQFRADNAGQPGSSLYSQTFSGTGGESGVGSYGGFPTFTYSVTLPSAFVAGAGTKYWLSVVPDVGFPPEWGWSSGTGGDGTSYQDFFGVRSALSADMAFSLDGSTVPEPVSMVLAGSVLGLLALRRRRPA